MKYDVVIIGAGLSGITCGALLAKRGLKVKILEAQYKPGGSCGIFKRQDTIFEQGVSMIFGFGESGFNPHRFVFNALEEEIDIIKHNSLYAINFNEHRVIFYEDLEKFTDELSYIFPLEYDNLKRFYKDMAKLYKKVIADDPNFISPDILKKEDGLKQLLKHPISYIRFLSYLNTTAKSLLKQYFATDEILNFFDKLTSTYCYTTVEETPAILAAIMFVDNHLGGGYAVAGSTLNLVGKLEKSFEENGGDILYNCEVKSIVVNENKAVAVKCNNGEIVYGDRIVYSGNVWDLYENLLKDKVSLAESNWAKALIPTYPSLVYFALVKEEAIPTNTLPVEMLVDDISKINEGEITVYIPSIEDKTLCKEGYRTIIAIGPSFEKWPNGRVKGYNNDEYYRKKSIEEERITGILNNRFKSFISNLCYSELSTPSTLQRYILKKDGSVAGPKQQIGQHMLKRLKTKSSVEGLYHCGESTVMGTGSPAVTVSGISVANIILREVGLEEYIYKEDMKNYVNVISGPVDESFFYHNKNGQDYQLISLAKKCQYCERPACEKVCPSGIKIRDINRRLSASNIYGAKRLIETIDMPICHSCEIKKCLKACIRNQYEDSVNIDKIVIELAKLP